MLISILLQEDPSMKRHTAIPFLCLLVTAFLAITFTGCPVTPPDTGHEGE